MSRARFDPLAYRDPAPNDALMRALGPVNRVLLLRGVLHLERVDLPEFDLARLRAVVRPGAAAFLGPNHPEFTTDWLIDKEISRLVSPRMAHWAAWEIVNASPLAQRFWLANNLIANAPGGGGKEYSVRWALAGHGVLLHPEGRASWHGDRVDPLLPGIVDMPWEAASRARAAGRDLPVSAVPIVWKLRFTRDVSRALGREIARIERAVGLAPEGGPAVESRFHSLQRRLLRRQAERLEVASPRLAGDLGGAAFFEAQDDVTGRLLARLAARHGPLPGDPERVVFFLRRAIREARERDPEGARRDRVALDEVERLRGFDPALYGGPTLAQEQIAETLKAARATLDRRGFRAALHNTVPVAVGPRVAHVRVPEPLDVGAAFDTRPADEEACRAALVAELRRRMQTRLDALNAEIAPFVDPFRRPNPFATR